MRIFRISLCFLLLFCPSAFLAAQESEGEQPSEFEKTLQSIDWTMGPAELRVGDVGSIHLPEGFAGAGASDTRRFLRSLGNIASGELAMVCPETLGWWIDFTFEPCGYVKDDEKDDLDASELLDALRDNQKEANKLRKARGLGELTITGWAMKPYYDESLHSLAWAIKLREPDGQITVNFSVRLLGRRGVVNGTYVATLDDFRKNLTQAKTLLKGFQFDPGKRYSDFREGDKIAEYGLGALIAGGGLALAAKTGLLKKFWKLIVAAFAGIAGFFRKIFGGKSKTKGKNRRRTRRRTGARRSTSRIARREDPDIFDEE